MCAPAWARPADALSHPCGFFRFPDFVRERRKDFHFLGEFGLAALGAFLLEVQTRVPTFGASIALLGAFGLAWTFLTPAARTRFSRAALLLGLAGGLSLTGSLLDLWDRNRWTPEGLEAHVEEHFRGLMSRAHAVAAQAFAQDRGNPEKAEDLEVVLEAHLEAGEAAILVAPDGEIVANAGEGLLHELREGQLPGNGYRLLTSGASVTVLAVAPLEDRAGWRLAVGRSFRFRDAPPGVPSRVQLAAGSWRLVQAGTLLEPPRLELLNSLELRVETAPFVRRLHVSAALLGSLGLAAWGARRLFSSWTLRRTLWRGRVPFGLGLGLQGLALFLFARSLGAAVSVCLSLGLAAFVAGSCFVALPRRSAAPILVLGGLVLAFLGGRRVGIWESWSVRELSEVLTLALAASLLVLSGGWIAQGWRVAWPRLGRISLLISLAAVLGGLRAEPEEVNIRGVALLVGAVGFLLSAGNELRSGGIGRFGNAALAFALSGSAWFWGADLRARQQAGEAAKQLLPPPPGVLERLADRFALQLQSALRRLPNFDQLEDREDLAFAVWQDAGLNRKDFLSALVVELPGFRSHFSVGLPLRDRRELDLSPIRWDFLPGPPYREWVVSRELEGSTREGFPARLRFWMLPRPGCCAGFGAEPWKLESLLAGELDRPAIPLPAEAFWSLEAISETSNPAFSKSSPGRGSPKPWMGRETFGSQAIQGKWKSHLFWPTWSFLERLELLLVGFTVSGAFSFSWFLLGWGLGLPRGTVWSTLRRFASSYSKRLLLFTSILAVLPVTVLYGYLRAALNQRLEGEQRAAAAAALTAVQRILAEYIFSLKPGYGIPTAVDDAMLTWLSRAVGHDVHLFWGARLAASSKPELFTSGLLGRQLPGRVQRELRRRPGQPVERRLDVGEGAHREVFLALRLPGERTEENPRLVLAVPLLGQPVSGMQEVRAIQLQALAVACGALLLLLAVGSSLARRFARPIEGLVTATRRVGAGGETLGFRPKEVELETIARAIEEMAARLAQGRRQLVAQKDWVERILETVASAVLVLDSSRKILFANHRARELLGLDGDFPIEFEGLLRSRSELEVLFSPELFEGGGAATGRRTLELAGPEGSRTWSFAWSRVLQEGEFRTVLVVDDVTEVLRAQRLEAWASMARIVAHEVKNPLTPIRLAAQHLQEAWRRKSQDFPSILERSVEHILRQVEELRRTVTEFSTFAELPRLERKVEQLNQLVSEAVAPYRDSAPEGVEFLVSCVEEPLFARVDRKLLTRAITNLLENAFRASGGKGKIEVELGVEGGLAFIAVKDRGPGARPEDLPRLLEPYFSTHSGGTGLGLPIAQRIAQEHGGSLSLRNREGGGFEAVIKIPLR